MLAHVNEIKTLVEIRKNYADALVRGKQIYQPETGNDNVMAYRYSGAIHELLTIVNISDITTVDVARRMRDHNSTWEDLITHETFQATNAIPDLPMPKSDIRVLLKR